MRIPLLAGSYEGISTNVSSQEAINFYYEGPSPRESNQGAMLPVHGATLFDTLANTSVIRALLYDPGDELLYVVSGDTLYSVTSGATETSRDTLATSSGRVEMALNPPAREIVTVDGNTGYHYDIAGTTATDIGDSDFPDTATTVAYINGRFLVNDPDVAGRFAWSDLNDGTSWTATSVATAQSLESAVQKILVDKNDIYIFGTDRSEVFYNSGDPDFVFERFEHIESGIAAPSTAVLYDNTVAWLRRSKRGALEAVRAGSGYQPQVFSTPQMSYKWEQYSTINDAFAYSMEIEGHNFYVITFPSADATWAYDALTKEWHQRSGAFSSGSPTREKASAHAYCGDWSGGTHILGDSGSTGKLFAVSSSVYTFDSANMERRLTGPLIAAENEARIRFSEVQVDIEEGVIQSGDSGDDRQLTLSWSVDGGHNFNSGVQLDIGEAAVDGRTHRLIQRKLGQGRLWAFRIYSDTPRKLIVKGAYGRTYGEAKTGAAA